MGTLTIMEWKILSAAWATALVLFGLVAALGSEFVSDKFAPKWRFAAITLLLLGIYLAIIGR